jgi:hypothetical protein
MGNSVRWRFAAASVEGTSHIRDGRPGQDAHYCEVLETPDGPMVIAVVSDGAGSAPRGGDGSAFICADLVARLKATLLAEPDIEGDRWLRDCIGETRSALMAKAAAEEESPRQFAATVLVVVLAAEWSAFAQLGDGAIVVSERGTHEWNWLFWPQRGEYANSTCFLTDGAAAESLQVEFMAEALEEAALFTDGLQHLVLHYAEQAVHSAFFEQMFGAVRGSGASGEDVDLSSQLAGYLRSSTITARADDDLTLAMVTRRNPD